MFCIYSQVLLKYSLLTFPFLFFHLCFNLSVNKTDKSIGETIPVVFRQFSGQLIQIVGLSAKCKRSDQWSIPLLSSSYSSFSTPFSSTLFYMLETMGKCVFEYMSTICSPHCVCVLQHLNHREEIRFNYTCNNFQVSEGLEAIYMLILMTAVMTCNKKRHLLLDQI